MTRRTWILLLLTTVAGRTVAGPSDVQEVGEVGFNAGEPNRDFETSLDTKTGRDISKTQNVADEARHKTGSGLKTAFDPVEKRKPTLTKRKPAKENSSGKSTSDNDAGPRGGDAKLTTVEGKVQGDFYAGNERTAEKTKYYEVLIQEDGMPSLPDDAGARSENAQRTQRLDVVEDKLARRSAENIVRKETVEETIETHVEKTSDAALSSRAFSRNKKKEREDALQDLADKHLDKETDEKTLTQLFHRSSDEGSDMTTSEHSVVTFKKSSQSDKVQSSENDNPSDIQDAAQKTSDATVRETVPDATVKSTDADPSRRSIYDAIRDNIPGISSMSNDDTSLAPLVSTARSTMNSDFTSGGGSSLNSDGRNTGVNSGDSKGPTGAGKNLGDNYGLVPMGKVTQNVVVEDERCEPRTATVGYGESATVDFLARFSADEVFLDHFMEADCHNLVLPIWRVQHWRNRQCSDQLMDYCIWSIRSNAVVLYSPFMPNRDADQCEKPAYGLPRFYASPLAYYIMNSIWWRKIVKERIAKCLSTRFRPSSQCGSPLLLHSHYHASKLLLLGGGARVPTLQEAKERNFFRKLQQTYLQNFQNYVNDSMRTRAVQYLQGQCYGKDKRNWVAGASPSFGHPWLQISNYMDPHLVEVVEKIFSLEDSEELLVKTVNENIGQNLPASKKLLVIDNKTGGKYAVEKDADSLAIGTSTVNRTDIVAGSTNTTIIETSTSSTAVRDAFETREGVAAEVAHGMEHAEPIPYSGEAPLVLQKIESVDLLNIPGLTRVSIETAQAKYDDHALVVQKSKPKPIKRRIEKWRFIEIPMPIPPSQSMNFPSRYSVHRHRTERERREQLRIEEERRREENRRKRLARILGPLKTTKMGRVYKTYPDMCRRHQQFIHCDSYKAEYWTVVWRHIGPYINEHMYGIPGESWGRSLDVEERELRELREQEEKYEKECFEQKVVQEYGYEPYEAYDTFDIYDDNDWNLHNESNVTANLEEVVVKEEEVAPSTGSIVKGIIDTIISPVMGTSKPAVEEPKADEPETTTTTTSSSSTRVTDASIVDTGSIGGSKNATSVDSKDASAVSTVSTEDRSKTNAVAFDGETTVVDTTTVEEGAVRDPSTAQSAATETTLTAPSLIPSSDDGTVIEGETNTTFSNSTRPKRTKRVKKVRPAHRRPYYGTLVERINVSKVLKESESNRAEREETETIRDRWFDWPVDAFQPMETAQEIVTKEEKKKEQEKRFIDVSAPIDKSSLAMELDYAMQSAGAKILGASEGCTGVSQILKPDPTAYMLAPCTSVPTYFVVGFAEYISLEKVGFLSLEYFASQFRHIQILGSSTYPTERWRVIAEVELSLSESHQIFDLEPRCSKTENGCWVRFLKIRILSQYNLDNSVYCALTKLQVFGSTVLKELDKQLEQEDIKAANQNLQVPVVNDVLGEYHDRENVFITDPEHFCKRHQIDVGTYLSRNRYREPSSNLAATGNATHQIFNGTAIPRENVGNINGTVTGAAGVVGASKGGTTGIAAASALDSSSTSTTKDTTPDPNPKSSFLSAVSGSVDGTKDDTEHNEEGGTGSDQRKDKKDHNGTTGNDTTDGFIDGNFSEVAVTRNLTRPVYDGDDDPEGDDNLAPFPDASTGLFDTLALNKVKTQLTDLGRSADTMSILRQLVGQFNASKIVESDFSAHNLPPISTEVLKQNKTGEKPALMRILEHLRLLEDRHVDLSRRSSSMVLSLKNQQDIITLLSSVIVSLHDNLREHRQRLDKVSRHALNRNRTLEDLFSFSGGFSGRGGGGNVSSATNIIQSWSNMLQSSDATLNLGPGNKINIWESLNTMLNAASNSTGEGNDTSTSGINTGNTSAASGQNNIHLQAALMLSQHILASVLLQNQQNQSKYPKEGSKDNNTNWDSWQEYLGNATSALGVDPNYVQDIVNDTTFSYIWEQTQHITQHPRTIVYLSLDLFLLLASIVYEKFILAALAVLMDALDSCVGFCMGDDQFLFSMLIRNYLTGGLWNGTSFGSDEQVKQYYASFGLPTGIRNVRQGRRQATDVIFSIFTWERVLLLWLVAMQLYAQCGRGQRRDENSNTGAKSRFGSSGMPSSPQSGIYATRSRPHLDDLGDMGGTMPGIDENRRFTPVSQKTSVYQNHQQGSHDHGLTSAGSSSYAGQQHQQSIPGYHSDESRRSSTGSEAVDGLKSGTLLNMNRQNVANAVYGSTTSSIMSSLNQGVSTGSNFQTVHQNEMDQGSVVDSRNQNRMDQRNQNPNQTIQMVEQRGQILDQRNVTEQTLVHSLVGTNSESQANMEFHPNNNYQPSKGLFAPSGPTGTTGLGSFHADGSLAFIPTQKSADSNQSADLPRFGTRDNHRRIRNADHGPDDMHDSSGSYASVVVMPEAEISTISGVSGERLAQELEDSRYGGVRSGWNRHIKSTNRQELTSMFDDVDAPGQTASQTANSMALSGTQTASSGTLSGSGTLQAAIAGSGTGLQTALTATALQQQTKGGGKSIGSAQSRAAAQASVSGDNGNRITKQPSGASSASSKETPNKTRRRRKR